MDESTAYHSPRSAAAVLAALDVLTWYVVEEPEAELPPGLSDYAERKINEFRQEDRDTWMDIRALAMVLRGSVAVRPPAAPNWKDPILAIRPEMPE
jgi:hypothetical protein